MALVIRITHLDPKGSKEWPNRGSVSAFLSLQTPQPLFPIRFSPFLSDFHALVAKLSKDLQDLQEGDRSVIPIHIFASTVPQAVFAFLSTRECGQLAEGARRKREQI